LLPSKNELDCATVVVKYSTALAASYARVRIIPKQSTPASALNRWTTHVRVRCEIVRAFAPKSIWGTDDFRPLHVLGGESHSGVANRSVRTRGWGVRHGEQDWLIGHIRARFPALTRQ
jgi:hypothetical protein